MFGVSVCFGCLFAFVSLTWIVDAGVGGWVFAFAYRFVFDYG